MQCNFFMGAVYLTVVSPVNGADNSNQKFSPCVCNDEKLIMGMQKESTFVDISKVLIVLREN